MARDYKIFHCQGDNQLQRCLAGEEKDGYELDQIIWTGNVTPNQPVGLIDQTGKQTKIGLIHLYLVIFSRPAARPVLDEIGMKKKPGRA